MENKTVKDFLPTVINLLGLVAFLSSFFYYIGVLYISGYSYNFGISRHLFDYQYNDFIFLGFIIFLPSYFYLLFTVEPLLIYFRINSYLDQYQIKNKEFLKIKTDVINQEELLTTSEERGLHVGLLEKISKEEQKIILHMSEIDKVKCAVLKLWSPKLIAIFFISSFFSYLIVGYIRPLSKVYSS